jgi:hypothetical protein
MRLVNIQQTKIWNMMSWGGGGMEFVNNAPDSNVQISGNSIVMRPFVDLENGGTAHGYHFHDIEGKLNLLDLYSPQTNIFSSDVNPDQMHLTYTGDRVRHLTIFSSDFEGQNNDHGVEKPPESLYIPSYSRQLGTEPRSDIERELSALVYDDFSGNDPFATYREDDVQGFYLSREGELVGEHRPTWRGEAGSPSASNAQFQLDAGESARITGLELTSGKWLCTLSAATVPSSGFFRQRFLSEEGNADNYLAIAMQHTGNYDLDKVEEGSNTHLIESTWPGDTASHTTAVDRMPGGHFELFLDGQSVGTAIDSFLPGTPASYLLTNGWDVRANIHLVRIE